MSLPSVRHHSTAWIEQWRAFILSYRFRNSSGLLRRVDHVLQRLERFRVGLLLLHQGDLLGLLSFSRRTQRPTLLRCHRNHDRRFACLVALDLLQHGDILTAHWRLLINGALGRVPCDGMHGLEIGEAAQYFGGTRMASGNG